VTLLEDNWAELYVLCSLQWSMATEKSTLFSPCHYELLEFESVAYLKHLHGLLAKFQEYKVNPAEFACLKAIVLFRSGSRTSDSSSIDPFCSSSSCPIRHMSSKSF